MKCLIEVVRWALPWHVPLARETDVQPRRRAQRPSIRRQVFTATRAINGGCVAAATLSA
jgi:hypothetical protein